MKNIRLFEQISGYLATYDNQHLSDARGRRWIGDNKVIEEQKQVEQSWNMGVRRRACTLLHRLSTNAEIAEKITL